MKIKSLFITMILFLLNSVAFADWYRPSLYTSFELQLQGKTLNQNYNALLYDIDLFDTPSTLIKALQDKGIMVICYFSAGSYENWRTDKTKFLSTDLGKKLIGYDDERWLDIRSNNVRKIMLSRLNLAAQKGCDGVDPDNVDGYSNPTGFSLTAKDQLLYNRFLAAEAHKRNLSVGLKNDLNQIRQLVNYFDFAINEQCHQYDECDMLTPFIKLGKPVFNIEYKKTYIDDLNARKDLCTSSVAMNLRTLILPRSLNGSFRISCDEQ